jgi:hypothetical protein
MSALSCVPCPVTPAPQDPNCLLSTLNCVASNHSSAYFNIETGGGARASGFELRDGKRTPSTASSSLQCEHSSEWLLLFTRATAADWRAAFRRAVVGGTDWADVSLNVCKLRNTAVTSVNIISDDSAKR